MSKSFSEALREKYCVDDENEENFVHMIIFSRPRRISCSAELEYLTNVVGLNTRYVILIDVIP